MVRLIALFISVFVFISFSQAQELLPPVAAKKTKCDTLFGDIRCDDYFWLREKNDASVINHLYAENGFSERYMKQHQLLIKKLIEEYRSRMVDKFQSPPSRARGYLYFSRYDEGKDYPSYFRTKDTAGSSEVLLLDFQKLSEGYMYFSPSLLSVSPDNALLMYGVDDKGDRLVDVHFKNIEADTYLADTIRNVSSAVWFGSDAIIYTLPEPRTNRSYKAFKHILGRPSAEDELIAFEADSTVQIGFGRSTSERFVFMSASKTDQTEVSYFDLQNPNQGWKMIAPRKAGHDYSADHVRGDSFIISTNLNAANGKVVSAPVSNPGISNWKELIPHRKNVLLAGFSLTGNRIAVVEQFDARERVVFYDEDGRNPDTLKIDNNPFTFSISGFYEAHEPLIRISAGFPGRPAETYDVDPVTLETTFIRRDTIRGNFDPSKYVTERVYAVAPDSTRIPVTITYKKGLKKDGKAPLWITGYGAYGNSSLPGFSSSRISLLDRGFVHAVAHVRGGMDCGREWYEQGRKLNKKNTFTDMVACVETLIDQGYTQKGKVVIEGGSAGGLLVGAVINLRPDLFGAALAEVPFVDVVNTMLDASLPLTTFEYDEWGNPNDSIYYEYIKSYAPYENIAPVNYPPILATGGYNDSQVPYWEPAKWVARLRETKTDSNIVLLKVNMDAGHGGSSGRFGGLSDQAFTTAFALQALGIQEKYITVRGKTTDSDGNPLPFVNVYIEGTTQATASNENGDFAIDINKENNPVLVFSSIGFKKQVIAITMRTNTSDMKVSLPAENYQIKTFEVKANAKDPAYAVMKKAIDKRKFHLNQVDASSSDIYIKSAVRLDEIPKKLPFFMKNVDMPDSNDLGLVYLSESVARYHMRKPDDVKEEMVASKVAGMKQGFSWNRVSDILLNFYENLVDLSYYSDRGFVSPVSESAMFYYKFRMLGTFMENGKTINRIELIPKRKHDPCFRGEIFIVDDTWNIHSLDLQLTKDAQIQFVDTLNIRQEYVEIADSLWMPLTLQLQSRIRIFGFSASDRSVGVFSNYRINKTYPKGFFGNEVFRIEEKANKVDTTYWSEIRPFTLTV
ncbi:MAG: prolyl oligopeptidase family serine peptidase, partial [Bacteroidetes bacterium]|nr:prolyl oligopeptidase family serine peptidase [Bacteroidota bacterium]